jgi:membrane-associated HD superfamily phosphohydrolase
MIVTIGALSLIINYLAMEIFYFFSGMLAIPPGLLPDVLPLALPAVLLTVMAGYRVALYVGFFAAMISALMLNGSFNVALEGFVLSAVCGLMVRPAGNYRTFFLRAFICTAVTVWVLDFSWVWHVTAAPGELFYSMILALVNALFTAVAAMLLTFLFELLFNFSTNMSLMVLCDYNHPLLKELHIKDGKYPTDPYRLGRETKIPEGDVDFPGVIKALADIGFQGVMTIECELGGDNSEYVVKTKKYLEDLVKKSYKK